jgi:hypothetical protein
VKFVLLIYNDTRLLNDLTPGETDEMFRTCFAHADELRSEGQLVESLMLQRPDRARSVRIRQGRVTTTDGPFSEAKEVLGGFNLIEAEDIDEAVRLAGEFPWARTGCVEVRPVEDMAAVRRRVGTD